MTERDNDRNWTFMPLLKPIKWKIIELDYEDYEEEGE